MEKKSIILKDLIKITKVIYEIPKSFRPDMLVPARIFLNEQMLNEIIDDLSLNQIINVATLPGIVKAAVAMPDVHQGYGFPIGGVAAFDIDNGGIISPGGIGYDINCGVRLLAANITKHDIKPYLNKLSDELFYNIPSGVGRSGKIKLSPIELDNVLSYGAPYMLTKGFGIDSDIEFCEENGVMKEADPKSVSDKAKNRGHDQLGTLGSGNHFLELQEIDEIYDEQAAALFGLEKSMVTVMIHCGSRGLGHQVCSEYVRTMLSNIDKWNITLADKELSCAPFKSPEAQQYYQAMCASANFAWANRHVIADNTRKAFIKILGNSTDLKLVYDLSHNIGKKEQHYIDDVLRNLIVHRKGATRAFGPNNSEVPEKYRSLGHPVLIPGTMGTSSYVMVGTEQNMNLSFGSCCHGAGRKISRVKAKKSIQGSALRQELEKMGIIIRCESDQGLSEEAPFAYKNVDSVVNVIEIAGIAKRVAKLKPIAVIKGG